MAQSSTQARNRIRRNRRTVDPAQVMRWCISVLLFFAIWEIVGRSGVIISIVPPSEVLPVLWEQMGEGELLWATARTLKLAGIGFVIGGTFGVAVGMLMGLAPTFARVLDPLVSAAYSAPTAMFIPVLSIYAGTELKAKVVLVVSFNIFVVILNTAAGMRQVNPAFVELGRAFGLKGLGLFRKVLLPAASPNILTGLRLAVGRSVQGAVLADLFLRAQDLGLYVRQAQGKFDMAELLAAVLLLTFVAVAAMGIARFIEFRMLRWAG